MALTDKERPGIRYADKKALLKILEEYNRETGFMPDPNVTAQEVREMMIACGVRPEENSASREIIRIREGEEQRRVPILFWDASALAKRFVPERGSASVDALFARLPAPEMVSTTLGYAETYSMLLRKRNRGDIPQTVFQSARSALQREVADAADFRLFPLDDLDIFAGLRLMDHHNLNAADASLLALFLRYRDSLPPGSPTCVLIAADQRLVSAAQAEGLPTLNPETVPTADVPALLASL